MSLSYLPNELLVPIFKLVDKVSDAAALSRTSRRFHDVYQYNLSSICDAVLPRTIEVYDQAAQLLEARTDPAAISSDDLLTIFGTVSPPNIKAYKTIEEYDQAVQLVKARAKPKTSASQSATDEPPVAAVKRAKKLLADADLMHSTLQQLEMRLSLAGEISPDLLVRGSSITEPPEIPCLEPFSRARFLQGWYRGLSVIYLRRKTGAEMYQLLASMSLLDLFCMCEIMSWLVDDFLFVDDPRSLAQSVQPSLLDEKRSLPGYTDDLAPLVGDEEHYSWRCCQLMVVRDFLREIVQDLETITGIAGPKWRYLPTWLDASRFFFIIHGDGPKDRAQNAKGVALADVLPLLPFQKYLRRLELPERH